MKFGQVEGLCVPVVVDGEALVRVTVYLETDMGIDIVREVEVEPELVRPPTQRGGFRRSVAQPVKSRCDVIERVPHLEIGLTELRRLQIAVFRALHEETVRHRDALIVFRASSTPMRAAEGQR